MDPSGMAQWIPSLSAVPEPRCSVVDVRYIRRQGARSICLDFFSDWNVGRILIVFIVSILVLYIAPHETVEKTVSVARCICYGVWWFPCWRGPVWPCPVVVMDMP